MMLVFTFSLNVQIYMSRISKRFKKVIKTFQPERLRFFLF